MKGRINVTPQNDKSSDIRKLAQDFLHATNPTHRYSLFQSIQGMSEDAVPILLDFLTDEDRILQQRAVWALGELKNAETYNPILEHYNEKENIIFKANALEALSKIEKEKAARLVLAALVGDEAFLQKRAQWIRSTIYGGSLAQCLPENPDNLFEVHECADATTEGEPTDDDPYPQDEEEEEEDIFTFQPIIGKDYQLTIELNPSKLWGESLYQQCKDTGNLSKWRKFKKDLIEKEGNQCWFCGDTEGRLIAHSFWDYDDRHHIRTLREIHHICTMCEKVRMIGKWLHAPNNYSYAGNLGIRRDITAKFCKVNQCLPDDFIAYEEEVMNIWVVRSEHYWDQEFGEYSYLIED